MLFERLVKEPKSTAIIFGTETTIEARDAPELLIEKGLIPVGLCRKRVNLQVRSKRMRRAIWSIPLSISLCRMRSKS